MASDPIYPPQTDPLAQELLSKLGKWHAEHPDSPGGRTLRELFPDRMGSTQAEKRAALAAVIPELVKSGLVEAGSAEEQNRRTRKAAFGDPERQQLRLTDRGKQMARSLAGQPVPKAARQPARKAAAQHKSARATRGTLAEKGLTERVALLEARVASLLERVEQLEVWQRSAGGRSAGAATHPASAPKLEEFRQWLLAALDRLDRDNRQLGLVPVPRVRRALAERVSDADFDRLVLELAARREVFLVPHDRPSALPQDEREACIRDPALGQLYYWFYWRM